MRRYRVFEPVSTLIYLGPVAALLAATLFVPGAAVLPVLGIAVVWALLASRYFWPRWKTQKRISFYAAAGFAVITNGAPVDSAALDANIAQALDWWAKAAPATGRAIGEGGFIVVEITNDGITAHGRAGFAGVRAPGTERARGLTEGNRIRVVWEPKNNGQDFYALLRHEVGHVVLHAMGHLGDHHAEMKRIGSPDA